MNDRTASIVEAVADQYGYKVETIVQMKTVYGLVTEQGRRYIWKFTRPHDTELRLSQLNRISARLYDVGIPTAGPLPKIRAGGFIAVLSTGEQGYLQPWMDGRHLKLDIRQERLTAVATVAQFHRWAVPPGVQLPMFNAPGGILPLRLKNKQAALVHALRLAGDKVPGLRHISPEILRQADEAVKAGTYLEQTLPVELRFCHRDLAPHNLLWLNDGRVGIIDFDRSGWDDPLLDLLQLFNHTLFLDEPSEDCLPELVEVYSRNQGLTEQRVWIFKKIAGFPEHLTRALVEWVRAGFPPDKVIRVALAWDKERLRQRLLQGVMTVENP